MLKKTCLGLIFLISVVLISCVQEESKYLKLALETEAWLQREADGLNVWPDASDEPENVSLSFSDGMSGGLIFYLELYHATGDQVYLDRAEEIGQYLLDNLPQKTDSLKGKFWAFSPYGNVCAPGFALTELYKATKKSKFKDAAVSVISVLEHFADNPNDTISWDLGNDVLGGLAGTGLFLLYGGEELADSKAIDMAVRAGETLISRAQNDEAGLFWKRGQNGGFTLPNFSHGNAGIAYFLTKLYEKTREEKFLTATLSAIDYLDSIAHTDNEVYLIPYGFPDVGWNRPYDIGWAHGPAGVGRLFIQLYHVTEDSKWLRKAEACYRGIMSCNPLSTPKEGFGKEPFSTDQRFGLAGVGAFAQEIYRITRDESYLVFSEQVIDYITSKSVLENGRSWPIPRFGFMSNAGSVTTFNGFFYGNVGYGLLYLNQYYLSNDKIPSVRFVDDPF
ncbi:hypothetical protein BFP97_17275 [Roseivirga sp. 4D4]|uniref:lanthionine synthetase LanC family protein n=1 Tax=Roseivirga sp. 4D4 TaxID=1889784 RepID=UPI00085292B7|nr:lanthionine synthetase LanC family protein [Roseivirga sp. 4D4]OEK03165.1 hypothetical protein BFP97_17275 [Roseivirga sp. 4D4]